MKIKSKSELKKQIEICDNIIILQKELIELYQMRNNHYLEDRKLLSKCYKHLIKYTDENYKGLKITE